MNPSAVSDTKKTVVDDGKLQPFISENMIVKKGENVEKVRNFEVTVDVKSFGGVV